jgi:tetratricopeptide (TPR) repeat protein
MAAEQSFRNFLKLQPDNAEGQMYLGYVLFKQKKFPEARAWLEQSLRRDASRPETSYYLAVIAQELSEDERAVGLLEPVVQRFPTFANAHLALGASHLKLKHYPRAQQELELAVKLNPDEPKAHYKLALLYARLKDQTRAQAEMRIVDQLKSAGKGQENQTYILTPVIPNPR